MERFFEILLEIFPPQSQSAKRSTLHIFSFFLTELLTFSQSIHFLWFEDQSINQWNEYQIFWRLICGASFDRLLIFYDIFEAFLAFVLITLGLLAVLVLATYFLGVFQKKIPNFLRFLTQVLLKVVCQTFFIPIISSLLFVTFHHDTGRLAFNGMSQQRQIIGKYEIIATSSSIVFLVILAILFEVCSCEARPKFREFKSSKINAKFEIFLKMSQVFLSILYHLLKTSGYQLFLVVNLIVHLVSSWMLLQSQAYYSNLVLAFKTFFHLSLSFISLFFLVGLWLDNSLLIIVLSLAIQPILFKTTWPTCQYFLQKQKKVKDFRFSIFELQNREFFIENLDEKLVQRLNENYSITNSKLNRVLTAFYCLDVLDDCSLALNKIETVSFTGLDLDENFQVFKCRSIIRRACKINSSTFKTFEYIQTLSQVRAMDKEFCEFYLNFFNVFNSENENFHGLKKWVRTTVAKWKILEEKYAKSYAEFQFSKELKEMFASFILDIRNDSHKAQNVFNFVGKSTVKNVENYNNLSRINSILMISADAESFGKVVFFDRSFSKNLKISLHSSEEMFIRTFFPSNISKIHEKEIKKYLMENSRAFLYQNSKIFFVNSEGFLMEALATVDCIAIDKKVFLIFDIHFLKFKREFAIVSDDGLIYEHSKNFPNFLNINKKSLSRHYFQEFFPDINFKTLKVYEYDEICVKSPEDENDVNIVQLRLKSLKLFENNYYVLYITEDLMYCACLEDESEEKTQITEKLIRGFELNNEESDNFQINQSKNYLKFNESISKMNESRGNINENHENKSKFSSSSLDHLLLNKTEQNSYKKSLLVMRMTKIIIIILILCLIASNVGIIVFMSIEASHSTNLTPLLSLNYLAYSLTQIGLILRANNVYSYLSKPIYFNETYFLSIVNFTKKYQDHLYDELDLWKYCEASKLIDEKSMHYWDLDNIKNVKHSNLFGFIEFILSNALTVNENIKDNKNYTKEMMNVISNVLGPPFSQLTDTIDELVKCETTRVKSLESKDTYLLLIGMLVIAVSISIITIFLCMSDQHLNNLWSHLQTRCRSQSIQICENINSRLTRLHHSSEIECSAPIQSSSRLKFRHSLRFLSKLSVLFILAGLLLLLTTLYFYNDLRYFLYYRPLLVSAFPRRRSQMSALAFVIVESFAESNNFALKSIYPEFKDTLNIKQMLKIKLENIKLTGKYIKNEKTKPLMSSYLQGIIFEKFPDPNLIFYAGSYRAVAFLNQEALNLVHGSHVKRYEDINLFIDRMNLFNNAIEHISNVAHSDTKEIIEIKMRNTKIFVSCFSVLLIASFLLFYYPMLRLEIANIQDLVQILKIIPRKI